MIDNLAIVIVFYNGSISIIEKARHLSELTDAVVIIDNHSDNVQLSKEMESIERVTVIRNDENYGIAYALNQGLRFAFSRGKQLLLTLDQDSNISNEAITNLVESINIKDRIVSVGPVYGMRRRNNRDAKDVKYLITSGNVVDVSTIISVGGYANDFFIDDVDIDLSFNLISNGYRLQIISSAVMLHKIGEFEVSKFLGIKYLGHSANRYYYKYRNGIIIRKKYWKKMPVQCLKHLLSTYIETTKLLFLENDKKEKITYMLKGIRDGLSWRETSEYSLNVSTIEDL